MSRKASRRDFLKGKAAVRAVADLAQGAIPGDGPDPWSREAADQSYLIRVSRPAMATEFEVVLNAGQHEGGTEASLEALDLVEALEDQMSVFRATSEISRLNRSCADGSVKVEPRLCGLLELALKLHAETGGVLDITSSPLSKVWGFH
ncbi:MAG: FAD:protein FMN transferase, partial [Planctomycetota bacterium]